MGVGAIGMCLTGNFGLAMMVDESVMALVLSQPSLPFPFGGYTCDLRILNRLDGEGRLVTDIHSTSRGFHWMAGRDVFLPLYDADGEWVAMVMLRQFGFDLKGVPDKAKHRRAALRGGVGNLKLGAERRFPGQGGEPVVRGEVPTFVVRGAK